MATIIDTSTLPFPSETLTLTATGDDREFIRQTAQQFAVAVTRGVMWSLGASNITAVPGADQIGGLLLIARILPLRDGTRHQRAARMAILISLNGVDTIDIEVKEIATGRAHTEIKGVYIDQLSAALLALDYDGDETLNPRYWHN
ncbi:MAG: hypothetical protein ACTH8F_07535 [Microbacterium sp.]|uniref:hypothetical protein n=1 Tax=Microbacterium sp. TaxID=51671 RepID=UPI003F9A265F